MEIIEVGQFEYETAKDIDYLTSGGIGPCIAVGAIHENKGYLTHYTSYGTNFQELDDLLVDLKGDVIDLKKLKIYVAGGAFPDKEDEVFYDIKDAKEGIKYARNKTLERISNAGFEKCIKKVQWGTRNHCLELIIDLNKNKVKIEKTEI